MTFQEPGGEYTKGDILRLKTIGAMCEGRVLDVGCGRGTLKQYLPNGCHYSGVDINPTKDVAFGSAYHVDFGDGSFDTVVLSEVLEHLERPLDALVEMKRLTKKPIGKLIISVPNPFNTDQIASVFWNGHNIRNPNHITLFGDNEIHNLCNNAGFKYGRTCPFYTKIPLINWLSPIKTYFGEWAIYEVW